MVLFKNSVSDVRRLVRGLAATAREANRAGLLERLRLVLGDCSPLPALDQLDLERIRELAGDGLAGVEYRFFDANLQSAAGHNRLAEDADADYLLILNPDTYPSPGLLSELMSAMSEPRVGLTEGRQIPLEHPKAYDAQTGDTSWASTCCVLIRNSVFRELSGFDAVHFPLYCDDVDFSWRVRLAGFRVVHRPRAVVFHDKRPAPNGAPVVSETEIYSSTLARLMLALKYGRTDIFRETLDGIVANASPSQLKALAEFRNLEREGRTPSALVGAGVVAQFEHGNYAHHRF